MAIHGEKYRWGDTEHLLASIFDAVNAHRWLFQAANSKKSRRPARPKPMLRPGQMDPTRRRMGTARMPIDQARAWMERRRQGKKG